MTNAMNPLKLYNYVALGVPSVSTPIANIDELRDLIEIADSPAGFVQSIEHLLAKNRPAVARDRLAALSWEARVKTMLDHVDRYFLTQVVDDMPSAAAGD